jgi:3-hydroxyisobutyrate dehydrogenase
LYSAAASRGGFETTQRRRVDHLQIGFIGLGDMGGPMALNLSKAGGNEVCVYDMRREAAAAHLDAGATWAESPQALAAQSELVMSSMTIDLEVDAEQALLVL